MSSNWFYEGNNKIKKIYSIKINSIPVSYRWNIELNDGLILDLFSDLVEELKLTDKEIIKIKEATENAKKLLNKKFNLLVSIDEL